jgi:hypothetical protein
MGWQCQSSDDLVSYNQHIRPIFNKNCLACHGGVKQSGGFSLLFEKEAFAPAKSGKIAIIPGNASKSELYQRLIHHDEELRMPYEAPSLTETEINLVKKWIDQGAKWEKHWAYIPPKQAIPSIHPEWGKNGIDHFVFKKLAANNLHPEAEADRATLYRRASLDLTGLPPSPAAVKAFEQDKSEQAYEKIIDDLLASPHFGERWAAWWLDLARYADSRGYEKDAHRNIWRYRDWVIQAFNQDMPFDQFTTKQLAGDLLPNPTKNQLIATAFHRNTMTNDEGGTDDEEFRIASLIDRVNTTFEIWQGTTMSCVQCHGHPYDPIEQKSFYEAMDFLNHTLDNDLTSELPVLTTYPQLEAKKAKEIIAFIEKTEPQQQINKNEDLEAQIKQALFPLLIPDHCDDFQNVVFNTNGVVSNWASNQQSIKDKKYRFKFEDIDLQQLSHISYSYATAGNDARIEVRLDSITGPLINEANFTKTAVARWNMANFPTIKTAVQATNGKHDLVFELINTTDKIPDGLVSIGVIELHYKDKYLSASTLRKQKEELFSLRFKADRTPIMQAKSNTFQRATKLFDRGNWLVQTEKVSGGVPASFLTQNSKKPTNRLEFANWLVSKENPLTARVISNRIWEQIFGIGIIESLEDLGTQSMPASHPQLLDYLANQFMYENNWSLKQFLKTILLSATYRQSSKTSLEKIEQDPYNRLLSRGPRFRLSSEQIRDQALAISDLLNDSIGGESVMPLQPDGVWAVVYNNHKWKTALGKAKYRRGLYTYWKRTAPYPSMSAFDAPSREFCVSRRIRTNTPLQSLVLLNDPVYLEIAEVLGQKMEAAGKGNLEKAIQFGYEKALLKNPDATTVKILKELYSEAQRALNQAAPKLTNNKTAKKEDEFKLKDPMTVVANAILNLDAFVMKE